MEYKTLVSMYYQQYSINTNESSREETEITDISTYFTPKDILIFEQAMTEQSISDLADFKDRLERQIANMQDVKFIAEWNDLEINEDQFLEKSVNSISWHLLLQEIDPTKNPNILDAFPTYDKMPYTSKFGIALRGSLILQLYVALVYNREILWRIIHKNSDILKSVQYLKDLLGCSYLRHMRNSLAHGSFTIFAGGICFNDRDKSIAATPSLLEHLASWLNLIILQAMK